MALKKLHAFVSSGPKKGTLLFPHKHEDGKYIVSTSRFEKDYIRVAESEILGLLEKGYKLRMSNPAEEISPTSLISPSSIFRPVQIR